MQFVHDVESEGLHFPKQWPDVVFVVWVRASESSLT
jgi:hypothetical protein